MVYCSFLLYSGQFFMLPEKYSRRVVCPYHICFQAITLLFVVGLKYCMDIFYPLIVILWGASVDSTDILVYIDEMAFLKH